MIVNDQEYNSYRTTYNWSDLSVKSARTANNRSLDVNTYKPFEDSWSLSKDAVLKNLRLTFKNKNLGDSELTNGDFSSGTTGWTNNGFETFADGGGYLHVGQTDSNNNYFDQTSTFNIASVNTDDYLNVKLRVKLIGVTFSSAEYYPAITIT